MNITIDSLKNEKNANGILSDFIGDNTDPSRIGPGYWHFIHTLSIEANTIEEQNQFIKIIKMICEKFPCSVCATHCKDYVKNNEIEKYIGVSIEINGEKKELGMFIWAWKFHNAVNHRTKDKNGQTKKLMSWDTVYNMYSNNKHMCSAKCLEAQDFNSGNLG